MNFMETFCSYNTASKHNFRSIPIARESLNVTLQKKFHSWLPSNAMWRVYWTVPLTSLRLASETDSLRSMSVPSDLHRGRAELLVVILALIRWDAMFWLVRWAPANAFRLLRSATLGCGLTGCQQPPIIPARHKYRNKHSMKTDINITFNLSTLFRSKPTEELQSTSSS